MTSRASDRNSPLRPPPMNEAPAPYRDAAPPPDRDRRFVRYVATCLPCARSWGGSQELLVIRRRNGKPRRREHGRCDRCGAAPLEVLFVRAHHCYGWRSTPRGGFLDIDRDPARPCAASRGIEPCGCSCADCRLVTPCDHEWFSYASIGWIHSFDGRPPKEIAPTETTSCSRCGTRIKRQLRNRPS